jgi:hypothetical protein
LDKDEHWTDTDTDSDTDTDTDIFATDSYPKGWGLKDSLTHVSFYFFEGAAGNKYIFANDRPSKKKERDLLSHLKCKEIAHMWGHSGLGLVLRRGGR